MYLMNEIILDIFLHFSLIVQSIYKFIFSEINVKILLSEVTFLSFKQRLKGLNSNDII